jgi:hypothetical protein
LIGSVPRQETCGTCDGTTLVVDHNVTVDLNPAVPTCSGDADLCAAAVFSFDKTGAPEDWKAIFNVGASHLVVTNGAIITVALVPPNGGNNKKSPGIVIKGTCDLQVDEGASIVVQSLNQPAGDIFIQFNSNITINGTVSNSVAGTNGTPGDITIASCCGSITTGPKSVIQTIGQDFGGSDINLLASQAAQAGSPFSPAATA